ncbi:MAG: SNF2-related protein [Pseudonocardia sp.]
MTGAQPQSDAAIVATRSKVGAGARATLDIVRRFAQGAATLLAAPVALRDNARQQIEILNVGTVAGQLEATPLSALKGVAGRSPPSRCDTSPLTATLHGYQEFGAQYAIHRERSILGDEMGLGKTVQALAAFAHLVASDQRRFLVVCPASVQINWLNETAKHSRLTAHSLHGADRDRAARPRLRDGGVAVTTFGTLGRLPEDVRSAEVSMLVVDEAHLVKNPDAARSKAVAALTRPRPPYGPGPHRAGAPAARQGQRR